MRRPAQHHLGPVARTTWAHPYTGVSGLAVFYNDGGQGGGAPTPAVPPVPSPADVAARAGQQPPAPVVPEGLIDRDTGLAMTQERFTKIMKRQYDKSRNSAFRELAESAGLPFDPETFDPDAFTKLLKDAKDARQAQMTEEQRRADDLASREKELAARLASAEQREAEAARRDRDSKVRAALVSLGSTGVDLDDAAALMRIADDADDAAITQAASDLKARRAELFGATTPQTLPPAPSGAPAGGGAPRPASPGKDAMKEAARARAREMGLRTDAA